MGAADAAITLDLWANAAVDSENRRQWRIRASEDFVPDPSTGGCEMPLPKPIIAGFPKPNHEEPAIPDLTRRKDDCDHRRMELPSKRATRAIQRPEGRRPMPYPDEDDEWHFGRQFGAFKLSDVENEDESDDDIPLHR